MSAERHKEDQETCWLYYAVDTTNIRMIKVCPIHANSVVTFLSSLYFILSQVIQQVLRMRLVAIQALRMQRWRIILGCGLTGDGKIRIFQK